ncbi:hypothetical protein J3R83DRAFT_12625 [Lanmaoa asiatica]|nr:hypothetical protein J3R83DRAFT_12625 [Lanmaoa asiatica]
MVRSTSNRDPKKKTRKIDKIKLKLVAMLRQSFFCMMHVCTQVSNISAGNIGFKLANGRLPWSTLEGDLREKGYMILDWLQGVPRDRDKGISGLSARDTDKLHDALFLEELRLRFIRYGEGKFLSNSTVIEGLLNSLPESADNMMGLLWRLMHQA